MPRQSAGPGCQTGGGGRASLVQLGPTSDIDNAVPYSNSLLVVMVPVKVQPETQDPAARWGYPHLVRVEETGVGLARLESPDVGLRR